MGEEKNADRILVGKLEEERPLGSPGRRWEDNIKLILEKYDGVVWTKFVWLRIGTSSGLLLTR
jgi:hypothetical protein